MTVIILRGDCRSKLRQRPDESVHMAVTSPPYWGLRSYGVEPTLWGGDPRCDHEWGSPVRKHNANAIQGPGSSGKNVDYAGFDRGKFTGPFCVKCGCWRGDLGLEPTPELFVEHMVEVFEEVRRVLRGDGTLWLNIGDSYASGGGAGLQGRSGDLFERAHTQKYLGVNRGGRSNVDNSGKHRRRGPSPNSTLKGNGHDGGGPKLHATEVWPVEAPNRAPQTGLKAKDLVGIPWMLAFALRSAGWWLRQDIIWEKPNPMPESIEDRCAKAHEYLFLLTKRESYFYDAEAIKEPASENSHPRKAAGGSAVSPKSADHGLGIKANKSFHEAMGDLVGTRNKRSVWTVATQPFPEAHFATFPPALIEPTILAGTSERGCCRSCMEGWRRVVEKSRSHESGSGRAGNLPAGKGGPNAQHAGTIDDIRNGPVLTSWTVGWYPSCRCDGIEQLPKYPRKPSEDDFEGDAPAFDAEMRRWASACEIVRDARRRLCDLAAPIKTVPAVVLDPFGGAGTTGLVADRLQRDAILCELKPEYAEMAAKRIEGDGGLFSSVAAK